MQPPNRSIPLPAKAIPPARDRMQSRLLVAAGVIVLLPHFIRVAIDLAIGLDVFGAFHNFSQAFGVMDRYYLQALAVSIALAALALAARAATPAAALCGSLICFHLADIEYGFPPRLGQSLVPALVLLFVLTSLATRFRRARKAASGIAEARSGRRASQVIANLGVAAFCGAFSKDHHSSTFYLACYLAAVAALAEATADTLSSEIGQGIAGPAFLITDFRCVPAGTDGAISLAGTLAGLLGAVAVVVAAVPRQWAWLTFAAAFFAAVAGLFFDSLLGATLERRGWLGNDLVNFSSTTFAAVASYPLLLALRLLHL